MARWIDPQPIEVPDVIRQVIPPMEGWETLVSELLVRRGMVNADAARGFLDPDAYTPALPQELPGLERTVERLAQAIERGARIAIWGDFDVDGQTATALYLQALQDLGANVSFTIPTRRQSHGVHPVGVQRLIDGGTQVILTADTGIAAHQAVALAANHGVEVLITDHHDLPPTLPDARAVVNPKQLPGTHPLYNLPGVGVAYQVVQALYGARGQGSAGQTLDLVALGIVADVALLHADVRYLLQRGLDALRRTERPGLQAVMALADLDPAFLTEEDIGFALAPRLNALSRVAQDQDVEMSTASGVELLTTGDLTRARTLATALEALNARRRWLTRQTLDAAQAQLERDRSLLDRPAIVVAGANWEPGIVGIVAGRLVERYNKPAIVLSAPPDEMARGSARSIEGVDIHAAIAAHKHMLYRCGGHPMAAGLSLEGTQIDAFRRALWRTLERTARPPAEPEIQLDAVLRLDQISPLLVQAIDTLSPYGPGNDPPVFVVRDLTLASSAIIGRTREHRRLVVRTRDAEEGEQTVLWWRSADQSPPEGPFDLAFTLGINRFRGQENVQLTWVDARTMAPPAIEVAARPELAVLDNRSLAERSLAHSQAALQALVADRGTGARVLVWGEGVLSGASPAGVRLVDRNALHEAERLVIWTTPPGPGELYAALETVSPQEVVLFCLDPGLDTPRAFLQRLAGMAKYSLREYAGRASLAMLAAALAHTPWAVRLGLDWLALRGQIDLTWEGDDVVLHAPGETSLSTAKKPDTALTEALREQAHVVEGQLYAQLEETAAYRAYARHANAKRLVGGPS